MDRRSFLRLTAAASAGAWSALNGSFATAEEKINAKQPNILFINVDDLGLWDDTFILFTSDNGGIYNISHQSPLRGEKGSYYEGGIRVPMIVRWPGKMRRASRCKAPFSGIDFFPTFLDVAGLPVPEDKKLDGLSLVPLLRENGDLPRPPLYWHFPVYLQAYENGNIETRDTLFRTRPGMVMRLGKWKLHEYFEDGVLELYNLENDIGERCNLAEILPRKTKEMHAMLKAWRKDTGAPVPTDKNPEYDPEAEATAIQAFYEQ